LSFLLNAFHQCSILSYFCWEPQVECAILFFEIDAFRFLVRLLRFSSSKLEWKTLRASLKRLLILFSFFSTALLTQTLARREKAWGLVIIMVTRFLSDRLWTDFGQTSHLDKHHIQTNIVVWQMSRTDKHHSRTNVAVRQTLQSDKYHIGQTSHWTNITLDKHHIGQTSSWTNIKLDKGRSNKRRSEKHRHVDIISHNSYSFRSPKHHSSTLFLQCLILLNYNLQ
jgi:hypothetical protein